MTFFKSIPPRVVWARILLRGGYGLRRPRSENCGRELIAVRPLPPEGRDGDAGRELAYVFGRGGRGAAARAGGRDGRHEVNGGATALYALASNPSAILRGMPREMKCSRSRRLPRSSGVTKLMASPIAFARPVRPMRWT